MSVTCDIAESGAFIRATIGGVRDEDVQACYRTIVVMCIEHGIRKALVIAADGAPEAHTAVANGVRCAALAGLPADFMLALVARDPRVQAVFATAEAEAAKVGIRAKVFTDEGRAISWLLGTLP